MTMVHVIGAGVAGLACAVRLVQSGRRVALYEAARHAGGRCRSFFDPALERTIDNGNHLLLGANQATFAYLDTVGARDSLASGPDISFPFVDLRTGARWAVRRGDWKLLRDPLDTSLRSDPPRPEPGAAPELFLANLAQDPGERTNRAAEQPDRGRELTRLHEEWAAGWE